MLQTPKKGFTLIELMVVIAIIGILAVALVPQLTGAQARSRDAARVASLWSISAVLETYYSDTWAYPANPADTTNIDATGGECMSASDGTVNNALGEMLKGGKAPTDPQTRNTANPCSQAWSFGYKALSRSWVPQASYALTANVETYQKANADYSATGLDSATTYEAISGVGESLSAETPDATNSMFINLN